MAVVTEEELLTPTEAAAYLKLSLSAFYAYRRRHHIPNRGKSRSLRVFAEDLRNAEDSRTKGVITPATDFAELGRQHARGDAPEASSR